LWRDGHSFDEACELLANNSQVAPDRRNLERIANSLPARPRRRFESDASLADRAADTPGADVLVERGDRDRLAKRVSVVLKRLIADAEPQERLILVLRFVDGRSVAEIASMLRLDQKRLYRQLDRLLRDLRDGLQAEGIVAEDALALFDDPAISVDWSAETENAGGNGDVVKGATRDAR